MNQLSNNELVEKLLSQNEINYISPLNFFINLILTISLSLLVAYFYTKYGKSISNRNDFSSNFFFKFNYLLIITIVKARSTFTWFGWGIINSKI